MLRLRHVLEVVDDMTDRLEHQAKRFAPLDFGKTCQRTIEMASCVLVRVRLSRDRIGRFEGPVRGRDDKRIAPMIFDGERSIVDRIIEVTERLLPGLVVFPTRAKLNERRDRLWLSQ